MGLGVNKTIVMVSGIKYAGGQNLLRVKMRPAKNANIFSEKLKIKMIHQPI